MDNLLFTLVTSIFNLLATVGLLVVSIRLEQRLIKLETKQRIDLELMRDRWLEYCIKEAKDIPFIEWYRKRYTGKEASNG